MAWEERPISSEQMYRIEDNGYSIFGMKKILMMENAGHGLADFILSEKGPDLDGKKIISADLVPYWDDFTYDLLPDGPTGIYFANGIPLGSTLR